MNDASAMPTGFGDSAGRSLACRSSASSGSRTACTNAASMPAESFHDVGMAAIAGEHGRLVERGAGIAGAPK
ncbi:hypothetical protein [Burkholderia diffusa]|uniref:hypothetical protein n=1 Tax=Burkholderia diffusa TaxID=488732 RepID=UPI00158E7F72|nr:hypothetical protein [Burkholderia diffusa]